MYFISTMCILRYSLTNNNKYEVRIINYGGIITNILAPDRDGAVQDVVLGFDNFDGRSADLSYTNILYTGLVRPINESEF